MNNYKIHLVEYSTDGNSVYAEQFKLYTKIFAVLLVNMMMEKKLNVYIDKLT